ncbi:interleukin-13 receptor subunit alpha-1 isoform X2 [Scophthalmus maximus]|uniref:interleukin-13 receptor subunit alpha-1 isoform X2 n=1 Tax=Scophthalmus maximus TaxID=52904 RepID=UPI0015E0BB01|nr:interleukin-13 receptor subunit alpha-1 isoform X2 [Scophthalmus maximus]
MTFTRDFWAVLSCCAMMTLSRCHADRLLPPTDLSYKWLDLLTVNVSWSWQRPIDLPEKCEIQYELRLVEKEERKEGHRCPKRTFLKNVADSCLTKQSNSDHWTYSIHTLGHNCDGWNSSTNVTITVKCPEGRADLVKNFKCVLEPSGMNCSWIPVHPSHELKLSHRVCGSSEKLRKSFKECDRPYSTGMRNGCYLNVTVGENNICIVANSKIGWSIIEPLLVIPSSKLSIREDNHHLNLTWMPPEVGKYCSWKYNFCYTQCNGPECLLSSSTHRMPYDENCLYKFRSRVLNGTHCPGMNSDWSEFVSYGVNKPPDGTLTVAVIVIPIILCVCVILSCYCFRRHSDIICPNTPDPSAIFKEMVMNGNKEHKTTAESLYTPVPEVVEPCKITLVSATSALQQNF